MIDTDHDGNDATRRPRGIHSYVLRQGRITPAQQRAFELHWTRFGLDFTGAPRDLDATFGRRTAHVLEIGFGNGEALEWASEHEPARDFLGIEVHRPGVGRLMNALAARDARNVRVYCHDAVEVLAQEIAADALDEVRIWFPDPWHKKRHHKRRLIQLEFAGLLASRVKPGGLLHLSTDWADYAAHMRDVLEATPAWRNRMGNGGYAERPSWRIQTRFEQRGIRLGHGVWDLLYDRI